MPRRTKTQKPGSLKRSVRPTLNEINAELNALPWKPAMTRSKLIGPSVESSAGLGVGRLHPPRSMFLRVHVGEASLGKRKYEMSTGINGSPIIHSKQTGKWFSLTWKDILTLAEKSGIDT